MIKHLRNILQHTNTIIGLRFNTLGHTMHTCKSVWTYCMIKAGIVEKYVRPVQDMYKGSETVVRCAI